VEHKVISEAAESALILKKIMQILHSFPSAAQDLLGNDLYEHVYEYLDRNLPKENTPQ
jgi:hypothetical protein